MLKEKTFKKNLQTILNESKQIENHTRLKNRLRAAGVNVVDVPQTNINQSIKHHLNELMDSDDIKQQVLSQKQGKSMYLNAATLKLHVAKLVRHFVKLELANHQ